MHLVLICEYFMWVCRIQRVPGRERIVDIVPRGTELDPQVKTGSWAGHTHNHNNPHVKFTGVYCA